MPQACKICKIFKNIFFYRTPIWLLLDEYRNYWVLVNTSWICLIFARRRFARYRFVRWRLRFVRYRYTFRPVNFLFVSKTSLRYVLKMSEAVDQSCSVKNGVLENFTKFTGKHVWQSLFFKKVEVFSFIEHLRRLLLTSSKHVLQSSSLKRLEKQKIATLKTSSRRLGDQQMYAWLWRHLLIYRLGIVPWMDGLW